AFAGLKAPDDAARKKYWDIAQNYVRRAEENNLDGVNGKLYRGRYELLTSNGAKGLQLVEQVVGQRPDYAPAHAVLGQAYLIQNPPRLDSAIDEFRQAVHLVPNNLGLIRTTIDLLMRRRDPASMQEAQELLKQGLAIAPTDRGLAQYGDLFGDVGKAIEIREK